MSLEIRWLPDVCSCEIMQDRSDPENLFEFEIKCELHESMSKEDARASIISMCIQNQQGE